MTTKNSLVSRPFITILLVSFFFWLGRGIEVPIVPLFVRSYGYSMTEIGLVALAGSLGFAVFEPLTGWLYDKVGMKKIIIFATFAGIFIVPLFSIARELWTFAIISFLVSAATAGLSSPTRASIARFSSGSRRGRAYGFFQSAMTLSMTVGPVLGGYLAQTMGYRVPFYVSSLAIIGSFLAALMLPKEEEKGGRGGSSTQPEGKERERFTIILTTGFITFLTARLLSVSIWSFTTNLLPVYAKEAPNLLATETEIGLALALRSAATTALQLCLGVLIDKVGRERVIILGMILCSFTFLGFIVVQNLAQLYLAVTVLAVGFAAPNIGLIVLMMDRIPSSHYGSAMGLYGLSEDIGGMMYALLIGSIYDRWGIVLVLYFMSAIMALDALVSFVSFKKFVIKKA